VASISLTFCSWFCTLSRRRISVASSRSISARCRPAFAVASLTTA
jgi:hypothetical protein